MDKLIRITTVPISIEKLLENQPKYFSKFFDITIVSSDKSELEKLGKKQGVKTFCLPLTRKITPFKDIIAIFKLYWLEIKNRIHERLNYKKEKNLKSSIHILQKQVL